MSTLAGAAPARVPAAAPAAEGRSRGAELVRFAGIVAQLGLLALAIRQFQIESSAFLRLVLLAFAGFAVHHFLPAVARLPFFALLSAGGIVLVLGLGPGGTLLGIGLALIALCHVPVRPALRIALLLAAAAGLAWMRGGALEALGSHVVWPILGSMFMFRTIVYVYDLHHDRAPRSWWRTLGYFFLLPNVCFPLFPVVDFKTFRRGHYDGDRWEIYQTGVRWMVRGVVQLVLYRVVYYYLTLPPSDIQTARDLAQYLVFNFLLYLRVSGQFHLVVGMLHLYGFNLPETNHRYVLSSSFTDFWRRINIYWKDFMMKVFYYPAYFKLKKLGETRALVLATLYVFLVTWFLHSWQWFWLRGSFPVIWQDAVFWGVLAALVVFNSLREMKHGRRRSLGTASWTVGRTLGVGVRTVLTFSAIVLLWSLWSAESAGGWLSMWTVSFGPADLAVLLPALAGGIVGAGVLARSASAPARARTQGGPRAVAASLAAIVPLAALGLPQVYERLAPEAASFVLSLRSGKLSRADMARLERGYYEDLMQVNRLDGQLGELYSQRPAGFLDVQGTGLVRFTGDFLQRELAPSRVATDSFGTVTTNRWGMRDRDYERTPGPGVWRATLLGASLTMGWGVEDGETYEARVEDRLNREPAEGAFERYEILNLAVPGYYPLQLAAALDRALSFEPDVVLYEATGREYSRAQYYLAEVVHKGIPIPFPGLAAIADEAGLEAGMPLEEAQRRLLPQKERILDWLYAYVVERSTEAGVVPVWVFVPQTYAGTWEEETAEARDLARSRGFTVIDLSRAYDGVDASTLVLADWDRHPNARGHALLAEALWEQVSDLERELGLRRGAPPEP